MNLVPLDIVTPDRKVYEGMVNLVIVKTGGGEIGIMPGHSPLMATVKPCVVKVNTAEDVQYFCATGGFIEVTPQKITILADASENGRDIDIDRAREALDRAEKRLADSSGESEHERAEQALTRARIRLRVAELSRDAVKA